MKAVAKICCFVLLIHATAQAEIVKTALTCETGICFYWWPKLPQLKGWQQDMDQSYRHRINAMAPNGSTFANADAVMYASAIYKPRVPETKSLEMFITDDRKQFLANYPGITIKEVSELTTGDGRKLRSFILLPKSDGNWEEVSYTEEGEFYLTFVLSSRSKSGFDKTEEKYRQLVALYKENLQ